MNRMLLTMAGLVFVLGWLSSSIFTLVDTSVSDLIKSPSDDSPDSVIGSVNEVASPYDWVKEDQIYVYKDRVIIDFKNVQWASFADSNSMDPVLDSEANALEIVPDSPSDIHVGDIVSYKSEFADGSIIHRVIETGYDDDGWYAIMKGDNLDRKDPGKIRFEQVNRVVIAIIY